MNSAAEANNLTTQPIPAGIPVEVTGSRVGETSGLREMFTEGTETVLLLPNGAVIRLNAVVTPGQLLFLKNKDTSREVVARLTKYKKSHAGGGYAELEFTEPAAGFWGAHFKLDAAKAKFPTSADGFKAASSATEAAAEAGTGAASGEVAKTAGGEDATFVPPKPTKSAILTVEEAGNELLEQPAAEGFSADDRDAEIAFLRTQLNTLLAAGVTRTTGDQGGEIASALAKMLGKATGEPVAQAAPRAATPMAPTTAGGAAAGSVANALFKTPSTEAPAKPMMSSEEAMDALLNDGPAQGSSEAFPMPHYHVPPRSRGALAKILVAAGVAAAFVLAGGGYWFVYRPHAAAAARKSAAEPTDELTAKSTPAAREKKSEEASTAPAVGNPASSANTEVTGANPTAKATDVTGDSAPQPAEKQEETNANELKAAAASDLKEVKSKAAVHASGKHVAAEHDPASGESDNETGAIEPAKVLKTVRAMAPAEATRGYVSGNVTIDAVVDENGRVTTMKVVSGPEVLRQTAMEALKKWEYQPAMRNGKPVASHVTAKIQFWYEP